MRKGRVLAIVPLLLVSVHLLLLLYPFPCDQPQFCETELKERTGVGFSRKNTIKAGGSTAFEQNVDWVSGWSG